MAVVRVLGLVLLLCLSMVEIESKILHGEQALTEIADEDDSRETSIDPHPATKNHEAKNLPSVLQRKNSVPHFSKREQYSVEMVDDGAQAKKTMSSNTVEGNAMKNFGFLSKEEAALVDQDVDKVLDYYGLGKKNDLKKQEQERLTIKEPNIITRKTTLIKNSVSNSVKESPEQRTQFSTQQRAQHIMNVKTSLQAKMTDARVLNKNPKFVVPGIVQKPRVFKAQTKKMPDLKLAEIINKKGSSSTNTNTKKTHELQGRKNTLNLSQQKNIVHSLLQENNGKLFTSKHNFIKDSGLHPGGLSIKDNIEFFQDDESQNPEPSINSNVAKAARDYMKMTNEDILKLVQNDQRKNGLKASTGGVDIAAPDWLPIKEKINGIQFDMIQDDKMAPHTMAGVQNGKTAALRNGRAYQQVNRGGVQDDMAQTQINGEKIPHNVNENQKNEWLPINDNILDPHVQFEMNRDGMNSNNQIKKLKKELKNESLSSELTEAERLNATSSSELEKITTNDNITNKATNLEDSSGNSQLQNNKISLKTNQNETLSNNFEVENILSSDQDKQNINSLPNEDSNSNFEQLKKEKDVSKQVWSHRKVLHSHGHEVLRMTSWTPWSTCSETCGTNGLQIRTRHCMNGQNEDVPCNGSTIDWKWCASVDVCPESGLHVAGHDSNSTFANVLIEENTSPSKWGSWSACSKRCGTKGLRIRTRNCPGQRSKDTGICVEPTMQWTWCQPIPCGKPQNGEIKVSNQKRGEPPASGTILAHQANGTTYPVIHTDGGLAFQNNCVVSSWSKWSKCSKSCGENSFKFRTRTCNCDYKQLCKSPTLQRQHCKLTPCEGEENYSSWSPFSPCTKSCGGGWKKRTRRCKKVWAKRHLCDQDLLIGVKVCNNHKCQKTSGVNKDAMVANIDPKSMCGFNPCAEFGCMDNPNTKCLADTSCDPVFFNESGQIDEKCRGWQRYQVKDPSLFCGFDPCYGSKCQRAFGRCLVDLNCKAFVLSADGQEIDCNMIRYPF